MQVQSLARENSRSVKPELTGYDVQVEVLRCGYETVMVRPYGFANASLMSDERDSQGLYLYLIVLKTNIYIAMTQPLVS